MSAPRDHENEEDAGALFRRVVGQVRPLRAVPRVPEPAPRPLLRRLRDRAAQSRTAIPASTWESPRPLPDTPVAAFHRCGLQHGVLKRLRRGSLRPAARLDLHGLTLAEAQAHLALFLETCRALGRRQVLVIHGKGSRSQGGRAVLKPYTLHWLQHNPAVLAYAPAQPADGGEGAVYVLLKRGQSQ